MQASVPTGTRGADPRPGDRVCGPGPETGLSMAFRRGGERIGGAGDGPQKCISAKADKCHCYERRSLAKYGFPGPGNLL